jgi:predicted SprT family Zn-dependent metalloprotease
MTSTSAVSRPAPSTATPISAAAAPTCLTSIRHHRIQRGQRYLCRACGQALVPAVATGSD